MTTIVTRAGKGSALTHTEVDNNFTNLKNSVDDAELAAIAGLTSAADRGIMFTGSGTAAVFTLTAAGLALLDDAAASNQRTTLGLGTSATMDEATDAQVRAATADKVLTAELIESASAPVALTDAATIALDWDSGINFTVTLGSNRTLGNPTNEQVGTWRRVQVTQDGTGSRTLALDTEYVTVGDAALTLTTAASSVDVLMIYCRSATVFEVYASLNVK